MDNLNFSLPFGFSNLGKINSTSDVKRIWQTRVITALTTRFGERVMRPDFGSSIDQSLFESADTSATMITSAVNIAFNKWLTSLKLIEVVPRYQDDTGYMDVLIRYELPSGDTDQVVVNTAIFNRSGDIIQEISRG